MNKFKLSLCAFGLLASGGMMQSCDDDDDEMIWWQPTALVTVRPEVDAFVLQLDDSTTLYPTNITVSPFGDKEVRALVAYTEEDKAEDRKVRYVCIHWIDSIRTKMPVPSLGAENAVQYGDDAIEIVRDWVTVAEDGYLTLRIRTQWGMTNTVHYLNLLTGINPDDPYELELRHDARGDVGGRTGDALIAFNLNGLPRKDKSNVKIKLHWKSFSGEKSAEFPLCLHRDKIYTEKMTFSKYVK